MLIGYLRPDARFSLAKQAPVLLAFGVSERKTYTELDRKRGEGYPARDLVIRAIRSGDVVVVSDFHRIGTSAKDLNATLKLIWAKGATVTEARTGRSCIDPIALSDMILTATEHYANRGMTSTIAKKIGSIGGQKAAKKLTKKGRMPHDLAMPIWRDELLTTEQAIAVINSDPEWPTKYNHSYAYRKLGKRNSLAGRRKQGYVKEIQIKRKKQELKRGAVYFLRADGKGNVKIGFTTDIDNRIKTLSTGHFSNLILVAIVPGVPADERELHKRFAKYRVRGEWFKVIGELKTYLASLPKPELE